MNKFHIVVATSANYLQGIVPFLRSFRHFHDVGKYKVHVLYFDDVNPDDLREFEDFCVFVNTVNPAKVKACKIDRFRYASELSGVVMMADADMFFFDSMEMFFEIVAGCPTIIVGGANGSTIQYTEGHSERFGEDISGLYNYKTVTSVPTIMDTREYGYIWREIYEHNTNIHRLSDFDLINVLISYHGLMDRVLALPAETVTGIHHFALKPNTRIIQKCGEFITQNGLKVLMMHGRWWDKKWVGGLSTKMEWFCRGDQKCLAGVAHSIGLILGEFEKWGERYADDN